MYEHVLERRPAERRALDLTRKRVHNLAQDLVAAWQLAAERAVDQPRLAPEALADSGAQPLGLTRLHDHDVTADLRLECLRRADGDEHAVMHEPDAVAAFRLLHAMRREHDGHAVAVA